MANKVIIGILVLLVVLVGGVGYYSYTLSQQVDDLDKRLKTFEIEQTARVDAVSDELLTLRMETKGSLSALDEKIEEALDEIETLEEDIGATQNRIDSLEDDIGGVSSQVESLEDSLTSAIAEFSQSMIDASEVYQSISQATVRITDGQYAVGSGFIFDNEAHVVTAHHVIENLSEIYVMLYDGRISRATTVGSCQFSDVAVLELEDNPDIEPPPLGDSSLIKIGEPVIALGSPGVSENPLGLRDTLTAGIISQVNRFIDYDTGGPNVPNLLQFDAAANFGNSGGPLANADGEIIGVVVARIFPTEGDGICYAVSSNKAKRVAEAIIASGSFDYPWVGVGIDDLTPQMVRERALETANGVLVTGVFDGSPADVAGIEAGDIIVSMDGVPIRDMAELTSYLGEFKSPGDAATIGLIRGTTTRELSIEVGNRVE